MRKLIGIAAGMTLASGAWAQEENLIARALALAELAVSDIPPSFSVGIVPVSEFQNAMPGDVLDYARFYLFLDRIGANCEFVEQRSNIEMLIPPPSALSWADFIVTHPEHPNRELFNEIRTVVDEPAEADPVGFCGEMYRALGPNGYLMEYAIRVNDLIDPELLEKYRVNVEDGVLWSTRDYCEREFYLQPPADEDWHNFACEKAKRQPF